MQSYCGMYKYIGSLILQDRKLQEKLRRQRILLALALTTVTGGLILWLIN
jgi:hypothetical protein